LGNWLVADKQKIDKVEVERALALEEGPYLDLKDGAKPCAVGFTGVDQYPNGETKPEGAK
jgi:hypothetical protein